MKRNKTLIALRLTPEAVEIIKSMSKSLGVAQADIVEMAVRKFAQAENFQTQTAS